MLKKSVCLLLCLTFLLVTVCACQNKGKKDENLAKVEITEEITDIVVIQVKDYGSIVIQLYPDIAPISVANFQKLVSEDFYNGLIFHRVIQNFMIQGGDPKGNGMGGSDETIQGEFSANGIENTLSHVRGTVSMARSNDMNSASSQFFIVHQDSTYLDGNYAAFGKVLYGMEVVDAIAAVKTNASTNKPLQTVTMTSVDFAVLKG